jgi:hypothetical protein
MRPVLGFGLIALGLLVGWGVVSGQWPATGTPNGAGVSEPGPPNQVAKLPTLPTDSGNGGKRRS